MFDCYFSITELLYERVLLMAAFLMKVWLLKVWGRSDTLTLSTMSEMFCLVEKTVLLVQWGIEILWFPFVVIPRERCP